MPNPSGVLPTSSLGEHRQHLVGVDNLRALLVAWVIGFHAVLGYAALGGWPYDEVQEGVLPARVEFTLAVLLGPTALFVIGTFFFLAGLFAPEQLHRQGPAGFLRRRALRLGVPWLGFMLGVWPLFMWFAYLAAGRSLSYREAFLGRTPLLDAGPLWFVQVLLYVSVAYVGYVTVRRRLTPGSARITRWRLVGLVTAIALGSFVVRLWFPARSQQVLDLHLWQWPQCIGMFALGVAVSGLGWAERVPARVARTCGGAVAVTVAAAVVVAAAADVDDLAREGTPFLGGWRWQALVLDVVEATLVVAGSVWLLAVAQRRLTAAGPVARAARRAAYAAFLLQVPVLLTLEIALRPLPWPIVVKAVVVAVLGVVGSFGLGWLAVGRPRSPGRRAPR